MEDTLLISSYKYCKYITKNHYENFPVASLLIPKDKRKYIYSIYAFARAADDFADELDIEGGPEKRLALLDEWHQNLINCYNGKVYSPIFIALKNTVSECKIPIELFERLLKAFKQDVFKNRYENFDEILDYCSNSAIPVGRLVLYVFGIIDDEIFNLSDKICTALQLTNFWQDVAIDIEKDRIYLPECDMKRMSVSVEQLIAKKTDDNFKNLLKFQVDRTENIFFEGKELLERSHKERTLKSIRKELILTWFGGMSILRKIREANYDVFNQRPVLSKIDILKLIYKIL